MINNVVAKALGVIVPDSYAVLDYEEFDIDSYDNFYAGMDKFIDEPQGNKVWSLGYGKASVLPEKGGIYDNLPRQRNSRVRKALRCVLARKQWG